MLTSNRAAAVIAGWADPVTGPPAAAALQLPAEFAADLAYGLACSAGPAASTTPTTAPTAATSTWA